jgi:hypothetical protein
MRRSTIIPPFPRREVVLPANAYQQHLADLNLLSIRFVTE